MTAAQVPFKGEEVLLAGFGGQGIMAMGQLLTYAGLLEGRYVSWLPSYGAEMRGGTANCTVVVSDEPVVSPIVSRPTALVAMNEPSLRKFEPSVVPGGLLILNSTLGGKAARGDLRVVSVPASGIADELGNARVANMVALGALLGAADLVRPESVVASLRKVLPARRHDLIPLNERALGRGMEAGRQAKLGS